MAIPRQLFSRVRVSLTRCVVSDTASLVCFLYEVELASFFGAAGLAGKFWPFGKVEQG